jgi:carbon-monoxide dehydrogenase large subunit
MTTTEAPQVDAPQAEIGRARRRKEDHHLITGRSSFTDSLVLPGMVHLAMVRSPHAHARIDGVDLGAAKSAPGVIGVWAGKDFPEQGGMACAWPITADMKSPVRLPVATEKVHHTGEIVAVVAARSKAEAVDAAELVAVQYTPLPVVTDLAAARDGSAPVIHEDLGTNVNTTWVFDSGEAGTGGNATDAIAAARNDPDQIVIERTFRQQRLIPAYMEPRSTVCDPNGAGDQITVWSSTQIPHILRTILTLSQGIPENQLRIIAPDVGGGFGGKLEVTPEEVVTIMAARKLGRPAKYTETRSECMVSAHHGRDQIQHFTLSARKDGTITGFDVDLTANMGAYLALIGPGIPILGAFMYNGIYKIPAYRFSCTNVFTNEVITDAYRGAGRPEATFGIERMMDELATELRMDPIEVRRKNWIAHEEFPFTTVAGLTYVSGHYVAATAMALELLGFDELRAELQRRG